MLVFDSHAHIFPYSGGKAGFVSVREHLEICQRGMNVHYAVHPESVRRADDNSIAKEQDMLWDRTALTSQGKYNVAFRAGKFGRFEWSREGVDYYIQYYPPTLQDMVAPPDFLRALMGYAGVDKAVLQCGGTYGNLNSYYAMVLDEYPELADSFFPLARINEANACSEKETKRLGHAVQELGLKGLWFSLSSEKWLGSRYSTFWKGVSDLHIPVFWAFSARLGDLRDSWLQSLRCFGKWKEKYPSIACVLAQSFPLSTIKKESVLDIPAFAKKMITKQNVLAEVAYPIARGGVEDYPYPVSREAVKNLYETLGPDRLVWGSDIPNVERYCTYAQSLNYLKDYCDFVPKEDMELILGKNLERLFTAQC